MTDDETIQHIDETLEAGEPRPGIDVGGLLNDLGTVLCATGRILHLQSHDFVEVKDVQPHVEMLLTATGQILFELGEP
jgi:hypothetical protein